MNKSVDLYYKSNDFDVSQNFIWNKTILRYKYLITSKFSVYDIFLHRYSDIIINIKSIKTKVIKKFTFYNVNKHQPDPNLTYGIGNIYMSEYFFVDEESDIIAIFFVDMEP